MNATDMCVVVQRLASGPRQLTDDDRSSLVGLFAHLDKCAACSRLMDEVADAAAVFEALSSAQRSPASAILPEDADVDEFLDRERTLVERAANVLTEVLTGPARKIAQRFDPATLSRAAEGASVLVRQHLDLVRPDAAIIELNDDGSVSFDEQSEIPVDAMALEIARFADLWSIEKRTPATEAKELARWLYLAAREAPRLMRHFAAEDWSPTSLQLIPVPPSEETQDPARRWRPSYVRAPEEIFLAVGVDRGAPAVRSLRLFQVPTSVKTSALPELFREFRKINGECPLVALRMASAAVLERPRPDTVTKMVQLSLLGRMEILLPVGTFNCRHLDWDRIEVERGELISLEARPIYPATHSWEDFA